MTIISYTLITLIASILPFKEAQIKKPDMESENPFIQRIHADEEELENYEEINQQDAEKYFLRGQTIKFSHPEKFSFISYRIEFIAMEIGKDNHVKSTLLYLDEYKSMLNILEVAFGPADVSLSMKGEVEYDSGSEQQSYTSHTWLREGYKMTFSIYPVKEPGNKQVNLKSQLYIR